MCPFLKTKNNKNDCYKYKKYEMKKHGIKKQKITELKQIKSRIKTDKNDGSKLTKITEWCKMIMEIIIIKNGISMKDKDKYHYFFMVICSK